MANTRDFKSLGVVASTATTITDLEIEEQEQGTSYRNVDTTEFQNQEGELFDVPPSTSNINQKIYTLSSYTDSVDRHGVVGWSDQVDYVPPALVFASDNNFYTCKAPSGVSTTVVDPTASWGGEYWTLLTDQLTLRQDLANETEGQEGARIVGYTNQTVQYSLDFLGRNLGNNTKIEIIASARVWVIGGGLVVYNRFNIASITPIAPVDSALDYIEFVYTTPTDNNFYSLLISPLIESQSGSDKQMAAYSFNQTTDGITIGIIQRRMSNDENAKQVRRDAVPRFTFIAYRIL